MKLRFNRIKIRARRCFRTARFFGKVSACAFVIHWFANSIVEVEHDTREYFRVQTAEAMEVLAPAFGFERPQPRLEELTAEETAERAALKFKRSPALIRAKIWVESRWNGAARSKKGARGYSQVMPANAKRCGLRVEQLDEMEPNIFCGAQILDEDIDSQHGSVTKGLQQYNGGPRCVAVIEQCGNDLACMGYKSEQEKGCAESFLFAQNVLNRMADDLRS